MHAIQFDDFSVVISSHSCGGKCADKDKVQQLLAADCQPDFLRMGRTGLYSVDAVVNRNELAVWLVD